MGLLQFLTLQFIAHLLADFFFQTDKWVDARQQDGIKSKYFWGHILLVFALSWLLSFQWQFIGGALAITLLHAIIDWVKMRLNTTEKVSRYLFFFDQLLHLVVIVAVSGLYFRMYRTDSLFVISPYYTLIFAAFLFLAKPVNIIIREIFRLYHIQTVKNEDESDELPNAGKLIGNVERMLTLLFILTGHFEAVGFLLAAKSILRFGDKDSLRSEYVLIGTLLSFGIAIVTGVIVGFLY